MVRVHEIDGNCSSNHSHMISLKKSGNYNIKDSLNFAAAPIGNRPKVGVATSPPNDRDFVGITTTSVLVKTL